MVLPLDTPQQAVRRISLCQGEDEEAALFFQRCRSSAPPKPTLSQETETKQLLFISYQSHRARDCYFIQKRRQEAKENRRKGKPRTMTWPRSWLNPQQSLQDKQETTPPSPKKIAVSAGWALSSPDANRFVSSGLLG